MCAIRLNWMADLAYDQAGAGSNEKNPCFTEGAYVGWGRVPSEMMREIMERCFERFIQENKH
jgi:hypothetical protein